MLRKIIILIICFSLVTFNCIVFAQQIEFTSFDYTINNRGMATTISTGNGFLKWELFNYEEMSEKDLLTYYSNDKEEWKLITNDNNRNVIRSFYDTNTNWVSCSAIDIGDYIILSDRSVQFPLCMSQSRSSRIYVIDKSTFNIIKECKFDNSIGLTSYVDGVFYITKYLSFYSEDSKDIPYEAYKTVKEQKTYCTTDFENWIEYSSDGSIPITNGKTTILTKNSLIKAENGTNFYAQRNIEPQHVYIRDNDVNKEVKYEAVDVAQIFPVKELYIGIPSTYEKSLQGKFLVSNDGIYFNAVDLPEANQNLYMMSEAKDDMVLCSINSYEKRYQAFKYMFCSYNELEQLAFDSHTYVQLNDKILGFAQPPVIESDRTLVPMRFLFEQMGANVDWNDSTQTATATISNSVRGGGGERNRVGEMQNSVTFSIDNINATVNGEAAAMDVPARLINDQTFVPLRFLSENLGYDVEWDESTNTAIITTE